jgi:lipopolysaccharide/colanic/teichoic acid biosynthesis glycosyltransferase
MAKRLVDVVLALAGLLVAAPLLAVAAVGIALSDRGPLLYRARRIGADGRPFTMFKLRTMRVNQGAFTSAVTAAADPRVFPFGAWLRRSKVDEMPQLVNVLRGEMSIIGPRPEDQGMVDRHYSPVHRETLRVRPGLASPGSIYNLTHGERLLDGADPEGRYVEQLLPLKVALDVVYVRHRSLRYDAALIGRTMWVVGATLLGRRDFPEPPEADEARRLLAGV